jgi:hypothetical protein
VKRTLAVGFVAVALSTMLMTPGAQAAPTGERSTSCSLVAKLKFRPPMEQGLNENAFINLKVKLRGCSGGTVASAEGFGGSIGDLRCDSGQISGRAAAKAELYWDTGDTSALNFFFVFNKSRLRGQVVDGLFKGERVSARGFSLTPVKGLCEDGNPLVMSKLKGTLKL